MAQLWNACSWTRSMTRIAFAVAAATATAVAAAIAWMKNNDYPKAGSGAGWAIRVTFGMYKSLFRMNALRNYDTNAADP